MYMKMIAMSRESKLGHLVRTQHFSQHIWTKRAFHRSKIGWGEHFIWRGKFCNVDSGGGKLRQEDAGGILDYRQCIWFLEKRRFSGGFECFIGRH